MKGPAEQSHNEHYFSILNDNLPGMDMVIVDEDLNILLALGNEIPKRGWSRSGYPHGKLGEVLAPEIFKLFEPILHIASSGTKVSTELSRSGNYFSLQIIPDLKSSGKEKHFLIIIQNITDEKIREEQLKLSKNDAEEANRSKSEFIANMSHEIRTPLNAINGFSEQLLKTRLNKRQSHFLDIVINASRHLISIINDILLLSRYDAGKTHLEESRFRLGELLNEVEKVVEYRYQEKNIDYSYSMDPRLDKVFVGDSGKIRQVLINIVSNAIKFTNKGLVEMAVQKVQEGDGVYHVKFEIKDTGIGIPKDKLEEIFEPFRQVDSSINRKYSGTGLGLTISKKLVEIMGGSIEVESKLGMGTSFNIKLPLTLSDIQKIPSKEIAPAIKERKKFRKLKVMLVDDDPVNRLLGEVVLKNFGIKATLAADGNEAIRKFKAGRFDLILLDIQMPVISGLDVAEYIRKKEKGKEHRVRIIAVTANVLKKDIEIYLSKGIDDFILKPFSEQAIFNKLNHYFRKYLESVSGARFEKNDQFQEQVEKSFDLDELMRISGNDREFVKMMLETFVENAKLNADKMQSLLEDGDFVGIGEIAHKLYPSFRQLGILKASSFMNDLETKFLREGDFSDAEDMSAEAIALIKAAVLDITKHKPDWTV